MAIDGLSVLLGLSVALTFFGGYKVLKYMEELIYKQKIQHASNIALSLVNSLCRIYSIVNTDDRLRMLNSVLQEAVRELRPPLVAASVVPH